MKINYFANDNEIKQTNITFKEYKDLFDCTDETFNNEIKPRTIITEQRFVTHNNICWYHKQLNDENENYFPFPPVILEYENNNLVIVDGNNRIAYAITKGLETIPAIIIIQNPKNHFNNSSAVLI